jgi:hypothetical protein
LTIVDVEDDDLFSFTKKTSVKDKEEEARKEAERKRVEEEKRQEAERKKQEEEKKLQYLESYNCIGYSVDHKEPKVPFGSL